MPSVQQAIAVILSGFVSICIFAGSIHAAEQAHHEIQLVLNPGDGTVEVTGEITVIGRDSVTLEVAPWIRMSNIRIDGKAVEDPAPGETLLLKLPSRKKHRIDIIARGIVPKPDEATAARNAGSDPVSGKDGVYLPGWSKWFPNLTDDTHSYRLTVKTPAPFRAVATGKLQSEQLAADTNTKTKTNTSVFTSQASLEAPSVFAGPYTVTEKRSGAVRLRTYFHDESAELAETYLDASAQYISRFEKQIGAYPFADFHVISAPLPVGLGFPNLTYVGRRILPLPFMRGRSLAHEVLHNWWANGVQIDYETGNWAEGLTSYMADHALAEQRSPESAAEMRLGWLRDYAALPEERDIAVNRFISKQHDANQVIGYGKVASIFHMLKHEIGPRQFEAAVKQFWRDNKFTRAGWSEIKAAFENAAQGDLDWYFRQWIERAGAPRVTLGKTELSGEGGEYTLTISLAQATDLYRLKVPVEVTTEAGIRRFDIRLEGDQVVEKLKLDSKPVTLRIDPKYTLFRQLLPGEAPPILRDVLLDNDAKIMVLGNASTDQDAARKLAERLVGKKPGYLVVQEIQLPDTPVLVFGSKEEIDRFIAKFKLPERPSEIASKGSGRAWVARRKNGNAVLFIEADDAEALGAMSRPLPHYRSKSFVVFDGRRALAKGVWPTTDGPLTRKFN